MIGVGVHLYVCDPPKSLNVTLEVDSPFPETYIDKLWAILYPSESSPAVIPV